MALFGRKTQAEERPDVAPSRVSGEPDTFLPRRAGRPRVESFFVRVIATGGIVGLGTAVAAILGSQDVAAWIIGLVVSGVSVLLAAVLWSARTM